MPQGALIAESNDKRFNGPFCVSTAHVSRVMICDSRAKTR